MATITADVTHYDIKLAAQASNPDGYEAVIYLTTSEGTVFLYFYPDGADLPDNRIRMQHGRATYYVYYHSTHLREVISDLRNERPISFSFNDESFYSALRTGSEPVGEGEESIDVEDWLGDHTAIRDAIVWESSSRAESYTDWSRNRKDQLQYAVELALTDRSLSLTDPPPNALNPADDEHATTVFAYEHAWPLFLTYIARSLAVEIGRFVSWSIIGYSSEGLAFLLDSRRMFHWSPDHNGYRIYEDEGRVIPAPPRYTSAFLTNNDLIAQNRIDTIGNVLDWCRQNMVHYSDGPTAANCEDHWQYRGYPPVSRIIEGTSITSRPGFGVRCRTAGCRGTTGFLRAVLRVVNIPVESVFACGHAIPHFVSDGMYLTHGDDPYNGYTRATPPYPARELLIPQYRFDEWFGSGATDDERCANVGRQVLECAITYLPNRLLQNRCEDIAAGRSREDSSVFEYLGRNYTLEVLEYRNLWERLDAKIESFGGCEHIP